MSEPLRLIVADDHPIVREGLVALLRRRGGMEVVEECADGAGAVEAIARCAPDVAIVDIKMPGLDGFGVLAEVMRLGLDTRLVLLTAFVTDEQALVAVEQGAHGIFLKDQEGDELIACTRAVARGERWIHPEIQAAADRALATRRAGEDLAALLTPREMEVVNLVETGIGNKEVAHQLKLSEGTVKVHLHNIYQKLGLGSRADLARLVSGKKP
jgi:DNA-binding NarL/FixJ family response regulator